MGVTIIKKSISLIAIIILLLTFSSCTKQDSAQNTITDWRRTAVIDGYKNFQKADEDISCCVCITKDGIFVYYNQEEQKLYGVAEYPSFLNIEDIKLVGFNNDDINEDTYSDLTVVLNIDNSNISLAWLYNPEFENFQYSQENSSVNFNEIWNGNKTFLHDVTFEWTDDKIYIMDYTANVMLKCNNNFDVIEKINDALVINNGNDYVICRVITESYNKKSVSNEEFIKQYNNTTLNDLKIVFGSSKKPTASVTVTDTTATSTTAIGNCEGSIKSSSYNGMIRTNIFVDTNTGNIIAGTVISNTAEKLEETASSVSNIAFCTK